LNAGQYDLPLEIICQAPSYMTESAIIGLANTMRLRYSFDPDNRRSSLLDGRIGREEDARTIGIARVQELPERRSLVRLRLPRPSDDELAVEQRPVGIVSFNGRNASSDPDAEGAAEFQAFCDSLVEELARLGFFDLPEVPRDGAGIRRRNGHEMVTELTGHQDNTELSDQNRP
jgi:hypothetical protein